jgi:hypothetical protein
MDMGHAQIHIDFVHGPESLRGTSKQSSTRKPSRYESTETLRSALPHPKLKQVPNYKEL